MKKQKPPPALKFDLLSYLLGQYGYGHMSEEDFWRRMREHGYAQDDIDWWCKEDNRRDDEALRQLRAVTTDEHRALAKRWAAIIHANHVASGRVGWDASHISANFGYEEMLRRGLLAEFVFADEFGLEVNTELLDYGDGGIDFVLPLFNGRDVRTYPVNIKSKSVQVSWEGLLKSGTHLRVPVKLVAPNTIYVFAIYREREDSAEVLRWAWGRALIKRNERARFENGTGEENLVMPFEELRELKELHDRHKKRSKE